MRFFTLHVRLTRDCNAHCTYCSSAGVSAGRISPDDFRKAIDFIADSVFPRIGITRQHTLTIEYLGGEVLLVPDQELLSAVTYAREKLGPLVRHLRDGAQSNLIGSERRVVALHDLFHGNLGTSWDQHTGQRNIKGSATLYRGILNRSLSALARERRHAPGRVIVIDRASGPHIEQEVEDAARGGYDLVLRPVFLGGSNDVDALSAADLENVMTKAYRKWQEAPHCRVEPFSSLYQRRATRGIKDPSGALVAQSSAGCPFQSDCAMKSLSLDPDGQLYICQEMADSKNYPLGNAVEGIFDEKTWRLLARRTARLSSDCVTCEWASECGGGCMNEAISAHNDPFGKTELCRVWKALFASIENDLAARRTQRTSK
jgi:radical SAM protein with 4Fe4S-binding SPASM domain